MEQHTEMNEALARITNELTNAKEDGKFMVAIWSITPDGRVLLRTRTTWQFPSADISTAVQLLALMAPGPTRITPGPLPNADIFGGSPPGQSALYPD